MTRFIPAVGRLQVLLLLASAALLGACASPPPKPVIDYNSRYDFSGVRQVALLMPSRNTSGGSALVSDIQANRINLGLERALRARGLEVVDRPQDADLVLTWHVVLQQKTDVRAYNTTSYYRCWACGPTRTDVTVRNYTEGTFIVDMVDLALNQSVWRGVLQERLKKNPDLALAQERADERANIVLASFPPY